MAIANDSCAGGAIGAAVGQRVAELAYRDGMSLQGSVQIGQVAGLVATIISGADGADGINAANMTSVAAATSYANSVVELQKKIFSGKTMSEEQAKEYAEALQKGSVERIAELTEKFKGRVSEEDLSVIRQFAADRDSNKLITNLSPEGKEEAILQVAVFFDGTNNNMARDIAKGLGGESNVARISKSFEGGEQLYVKGVGSGSWFDRMLCGFTGCGEQDNINYANNRLTKIYNENDGDKILILDTVGFSRGAATALTFGNQFLANGIPGVVSPNMVDINTQYLIDPVASFGWPGNNIDFGQNFLINPDIGKSVTFIATSEYRRLFDLQSPRYADGSMPFNAQEIYLVGAHSDAGAGYEDGEGNISNDLGKINLGIILNQAKQDATVYGNIQNNYPPTKDAKNTYNNYVNAQNAYYANPNATTLEAYKNTFNILNNNYIHDSRMLIDYGRTTRDVYYQNPN